MSLWVVYVKDKSGELHWWAKCDCREDAIGIAKAAVEEYEEIVGWAVSEVIGPDK